MTPTYQFWYLAATLFRLQARPHAQLAFANCVMSVAVEQQSVRLTAIHECGHIIPSFVGIIKLRTSYAHTGGAS